ncbi:hypothetical protein [Marinilabilia sp.]|uniref:hypothetical protein n=1 Tax=Marinilabilia sp. TaxID=2021252 RepID=UPI0025BA868D|nr:hypothetical protein [Marinilabilia sp.]
MWQLKKYWFMCGKVENFDEQKGSLEQRPDGLELNLPMSDDEHRFSGSVRRDYKLSFLKS